MEPFTDIQHLCESLQGVIKFEPDGHIELLVPQMFRRELVDRLVWTSVFGSSKRLRQIAGFVIRVAAGKLGIWCDSTSILYSRIQMDSIEPFTVPAFKIPGLTYFTARMLFRSALSKKVGPFIFELSPSEMEYTQQSPGELTSCVLGAALRENHCGPVFLQAAHFKFNENLYKQDSKAEIQSMSDLIDESIEAGFYNIDLDGSDRIDLTKTDLSAQQKPHIDFMVKFIQHIRSKQPDKINITVGGEIRKIGCALTESRELETFMNGLDSELQQQSSLNGINKINVNFGSPQDNTTNPDGTPKEIVINNELLSDLATIARNKFDLAFAVRHGASIIQKSGFSIFPGSEAVEVHLSSEIQNMIFDHPRFPIALQEGIRSYLETHHNDTRDDQWTDQQFYYNLRKKAWGPFKKSLWSLDKQTKSIIFADVLNECSFFWESLNLENTRKYIDKFYPEPSVGYFVNPPVEMLSDR